MSDATSPESRHGYITVPFPYQGTVYNFTFYEGFVGRIVLRPQGGPPVEVYKQEGVYHVPQPKSGEVRYADVNSTIKVTGGPSNLDVELAVDDGPQHQGRGPINRIKLRARKEKGGPKGRDAASPEGPSVKILRGEDQVEGLSMELKAGRGASRGGVQAFQTSSGDDVDFENGAKTCPPHC